MRAPSVRLLRHSRISTMKSRRSSSLPLSSTRELCSVKPIVPPTSSDLPLNSSLISISILIVAPSFGVELVGSTARPGSPGDSHDPQEVRTSRWHPQLGTAPAGHMVLNSHRHCFPLAGIEKTGWIYASNQANRPGV